MLDPQLIRNKLDTIVEESLRRGVLIDKNKIKKIEDNRKKIQVETEKLQSERNNHSKKIGELKSTRLIDRQISFFNRRNIVIVT